MQFLTHPRASLCERFSLRSWLGAFSLLLGLIVSITSASTALAVNSTSSLIPQHVHQTATCPNCMTPHGGYVQATPRVYLVFWGPKWLKNNPNTYDPNTAIVVNSVTNLFSELAGGDLNNIMRQYGVQNTVLFNPTTSIWFDPTVPPLITQANSSDEAASAVKTNHWANENTNTNTQVILFPQAGTSYNSVYFNPAKICGQHDLGTDVAVNALPFSVVSYGTDSPGCNSSSATPATTAIAENMTKAAFHEYAETATDPGANVFDLGTGWFYNSSQSGEIGDLCNDKAFYYQPVPPYYPGGPYHLPEVFVQELWSNVNGGCVSQVGQEYTSPVSPGMHTVQGAILGHYTDHNNAIMNLVGLPTSEEVEVGSGRVSYFAGDGCGSFSGPYSSKSAIYWSPGPAPRTWEVGGCIYQHYLTPGGDLQGQGGPTTKLGFPTSDVLSISGGFVSYFAGNKCGSGGPNNSGSAIYYHNSTAAFVTGCIYSTYIGDGGYQSYIGFPVSDEVYYPSQGTYASYFAGNKCGYYSHPYGSGTAIYTDSYGTFVVSGCIYDAYIDYHEYNGPLGVPTSDTTQISGGWLNQFSGTSCGSGLWQGSGSAIYTAKDTSEVQGCIYQEYLHMGGSSGALGFPLSNELPIGGYNGVSGHVSYFAGGNCGNPGTDNSNSAIYDTPATGAHEVQGCIYASYLKYGGPGSRLGFPISDEYTGSTGYRESDFTGGTILWTGSGASIILN